MKALLIAAHGSRRTRSNQEVEELAAALSIHLQETFCCVKAAFLELATPSIAEAIDQCASEGATSIVLLPYFLASGRHVVEDIPKIVDTAQERHPALQFIVSEHIGRSQMMVSLLEQMATGA